MHSAVQGSLPYDLISVPLAAASQLGSSGAGTCLQAFGSQLPQGAASEVLYEEVTRASS